jgi:UDP-glucuronate 4-epimerase
VNFLVTGGAGFIGSHVCERLLHSGHAVWAFDDLNAFYDPSLKRRNLGESQTVTLARLVELLESALGKKAIIHRQPPQPGEPPR